MENTEPLQGQVPRGGPIYHPDFVGPVTKVPVFENLIVDELKSLWSELCVDSSQALEEDLSADELKIFSEEELVDKALKVAFQDDRQMEDPDVLVNRMRADDSGASSSKNVPEDSGKERNVVSGASMGGTLVETGNGDNSEKLDSVKSKKKKRGRTFDRNNRATDLDSSYIAKVEELAKIKQKQDEDRAAARLHSFNGGCKVNEGPKPASETSEKMKSLRFITSTKKVKASNKDNYVAITHPEVVLCVEIYHGVKHWIKTQEFLVLGRQTLAELRDKISCRTDQLMQKEGQHDPSGYFLIEDVLLNDLRDPSAIDYSEHIFEWLRNSNDEAVQKWEWIQSGEFRLKQKALFNDTEKPPLPNFQAYAMNNVRFSELSFHLGARYLYCHQGDCKHNMVIRDMRLIHPEDIQNRLSYPVLIFQIKFRAQKCNICKIYQATKVTVDDKWAQENPCFFCENCYYLLHYTKEGSLLYNEFTVYDHYPD